MIVLKERVEDLEQEYQKVRKALEFIMPVIMEKMEDGEFKTRMIERRKEQLINSRGLKVEHTEQADRTSFW